MLQGPVGLTIWTQCLTSPLDALRVKVRNTREKGKARSTLTVEQGTILSQRILSLRLHPRWDEFISENPQHTILHKRFHLFNSSSNWWWKSPSKIPTYRIRLVAFACWVGFTLPIFESFAEGDTVRLDCKLSLCLYGWYADIGWASRKLSGGSEMSGSEMKSTGLLEEISRIYIRK